MVWKVRKVLEGSRRFGRFRKVRKVLEYGGSFRKVRKVPEFSGTFQKTPAVGVGFHQGVPSGVGLLLPKLAAPPPIYRGAGRTREGTPSSPSPLAETLGSRHL